MLPVKSSATLTVLHKLGVTFVRNIQTDVMPLKLAANLTTLFPEAKSISERYEKAKKAGFHYVECAFPFAEPKEQLQNVNKKLGLEHVLFNGYPGDVRNGDRGIAALPDRKKEFQDNVDINIQYAKALDCKRIHVMAGVTKGLDQKLCDETYLENIALIADKFAKEGLTCMLEPINDSVTIPGYYLTDVHKAVEIIKKLNRPNVKLQFDFFHMQLLHGNFTENFKKYYPYIGHIQVAQAPDRTEPGFQGEVDYSYVFKLLEDHGYDGYVGLEYMPKGDTVEGLRWLKEMNMTL
ncbi:putative hydroxypyruvate isomerase [Mytilus californianus]|uniref:putative hydroxypyruvate isomerase n=1 Tax=Mytilus californianus TaxID=6549 RepID=UPI002245AE56|nr:putative hydroxypyruvate isomerase [Mytilus californianus]